MSLRDWSSPYNEIGVVSRAARKKVSLSQLNQMPEDDGLADFEPMRPEPPETKNATKPVEKVEIKKVEMEESWDPYPPLTQTPTSPDISQQVAYMIQLLEEQRDEKTGHVTEEIILYLFLGIFVIFVVDTFVKTGRYSR